MNSSSDFFWNLSFQRNSILKKPEQVVESLKAAHFKQTQWCRGCSTNISVIHWLSHLLWNYLQNTVRAREVNFWENVHHPPCVACHVSHVMCNMSHVRCHVPPVSLGQFNKNDIVVVALAWEKQLPEENTCPVLNNFIVMTTANTNSHTIYNSTLQNNDGSMWAP